MRIKEENKHQEKVEKAILDYLNQHGNVDQPVLVNYIDSLTDDRHAAKKSVRKYLKDMAEQRKITFIPFTKGQRTYYQISTYSMENTTFQKSSPIREETELSFIGELKKIPVISFADFKMNCQSVVYKTNSIPSNPTKFLDYHEGNSVELRVDDTIPTVKLTEELLDEIRENNRDVASEIEKNLDEGIQGYPRLVGLPKITKNQNLKNLNIDLGNCDFGITYLGALHANGIIKSANLDKMKEKFQLGNIGVRILLVYKRDGRTKALFHERGKRNSGYVGAWDATAAGYINPQDCLDADTQRLSVWKASKLELLDELRFDDYGDKKLPHREEYWYFDIIREMTTETFDIVGLARRSVSDEAYDLEEINKNVKGHGYVEKVDECDLDPISIAHFIKEKKYWVPGGIYAAIMALHAINKISIDEIEKTFKEEKVFSNGDVSVEAYR